MYSIRLKATSETGSFHTRTLMARILIALAFFGTAPTTVAWAQSPQGLEGFTSPYRDVRIGSSYTTTVTEIRVGEGDRVESGQVLVQLDDAVPRAALEVAREAASARGELEAAQQLLKTKQRRLEQIRELLSRDHATPQELRMAEDEREEAAARVKAHDELIARRQQELVRSKAELHRMTVRSPLEGIVVEVFRDVGEVVSPAEPHLIRVVQLDPLKVIATGPAEQVQKMRKGEELSVLIGTTEHNAMIQYISPIVDAQSGMRKIHLRLPNPDNLIPSGVPCHVRGKKPATQTPGKQNTVLQQSVRARPTTYPFIR